MPQIVLATKNQGKILEFQRLLSKHAGEVKVLGLSDFPDLPDVEESGKTLSENAKLKAKAIFDFTNLPALADDSGLFIDALNSDPGILSARWGGYQGSDSAIRDQINVSKVLDQLKDVPLAGRSAQFKAVVYFYMKKSNAVNDHLFAFKSVISWQFNSIILNLGVVSLSHPSLR